MPYLVPAVAGSCDALLMGSGESPLHHNVVAAAIIRSGKVLLCHRHPDRRWYPDVWDLPGGHIEAGETPLDALAREICEETGVVIDLAETVSVFCHSPNPDLDIEVWAVTSWKGGIINAAPEEHDQIAWFTAPEVETLDLADPGVAVACRRALTLAS